MSTRYAYITYYVFVPYRGIYFLYVEKTWLEQKLRSFRPLSGNLLSLQKTGVYESKDGDCFRPLSGNLLSLPIKA